MKRLRTIDLSKGFTLVELMITFTIASVVMASVFVMYTQATDAFNKEEEAIGMHSQLRFAMDNLKNDIRRAGFHATPHSVKDVSRVCWTPPGTELLGLSIDINSGFVHLPSENSEIRPSSITLFGDYFSTNSKGYYAYQVDSGGNVFMDPSDPDLANMKQAEFEAIFRPNVRWLRVVTKDEKEWYSKIVAVDYPNRRLTLASSPPGSGYCLAGFGQGWVNPVGWIRYEVREDTRTDTLLAEGANLRNSGKSDLVRLEVREDGTPVEATALVIAEYVIDMQFYDFGIDESVASTGTTITHYPFVENVVAPGGGGILGTDGTVAQTNNLRFMTPKLSVRTPHEDEDHTFEKRKGLYGPIRFFELEPDLIGSARVESLASRVDLRNFTIRRLK